MSEQDILVLQNFQQKLESFLSRQLKTIKEKLKSILQHINLRDQQIRALLGKLEGMQGQFEI